jgi:hypothetical protein
MLPLPRVPFADGYVTLTTTEGIIGSKRTELQALVSAAFEASRIFVSDRAAVVDLMREECLPGLGEHFELKNDHDLERLYEQLIEAARRGDVLPAAAVGRWHHQCVSNAGGCRSRDARLQPITDVGSQLRPRGDAREVISEKDDADR